jgi:hypothetical protein
MKVSVVYISVRHSGAVQHLHKLSYFDQTLRLHPFVSLLEAMPAICASLLLPYHFVRNVCSMLAPCFVCSKSQCGYGIRVANIVNGSLQHDRILAVTNLAV